jgi:hypothetical protein
MADPDQFRKETRAWLQGHCPPEMRQPMSQGCCVHLCGHNPQSQTVRHCRDYGDTEQPQRNEPQQAHAKRARWARLIAQ